MFSLRRKRKAALGPLVLGCTRTPIRPTQIFKAAIKDNVSGFIVIGFDLFIYGGIVPKIKGDHIHKNRSLFLFGFEHSGTNDSFSDFYIKMASVEWVISDMLGIDHGDCHRPFGYDLTRLQFF